MRKLYTGLFLLLLNGGSLAQSPSEGRPLSTGEANCVHPIVLQLSDATAWSAEQSTESDTDWGLFKTLSIIGALGLFIFGMKIMSEGLQKVSGVGLRKMLSSITSNPFKGILTGFGITSIVQSSSVTTVMIVSFVNAGLITLRQSVGVMMGANIGTTVTAWIVLVMGFKLSIPDYTLVLMAIGVPLLFFSKGAIKVWASVVIGLTLLMMGLEFLKEVIPKPGVDSDLVQFFVAYKETGLLGTLMFIGLGTLVTVVIQSSSAAIALTMTMVASGVLPFEVAAAVIMGENIGTTVTAQLAALIGNVHAKRAARIHALFNILGVAWCALVFRWLLNGIAFFMPSDPFTEPEAANLGIVAFHSIFNIINASLLVGFIPRLVQLVEKLVRSKGEKDESFHLDYIGVGVMGTPDLSLLEAKKEIAKFGEITARMSSFVQQLLTVQHKKERYRLHERITKYEQITDRVEVEVADYLTRVAASGDLSVETAQTIRSMNAIVNDLERIGDIFYQMGKAIERKQDEKVYFLPEQRQRLQQMFQLVDAAFDVMVRNLHADWSGVNIEEALDTEQQINKKRDDMRKEYLSSLEKKAFSVKSGIVFNNLFSSCEKVGDHLINVTEAIVGRIG